MLNGSLAVWLLLGMAIGIILETFIPSVFLGTLLGATILVRFSLQNFASPIWHEE